MSGKRSIKGMMIVVVLSVLAVIYLYQHSCSVRMTQELVQLEQGCRLEVERVESLEVEVERLKSFSRLESLWESNREMLFASEVLAVESLRMADVANTKLMVR